MNSDVHPAIVALVLAMTAIAVATWMWGSDVAASYGGPAELASAPDGHAFVQIQNYLVEHDVDGDYLETHDLTDMGVDLFLGGFAFFSDGDILLRRGPDPRSFFDNLRAYKRETNQNSIVPESPDSGLFRCDLDTQGCERFGGQGIDFKAAFSVFIDWSTDEVYISDTTRHLLRKYSSKGVELAPPEGGFQFPNQLMLHDDVLLVADTNHHVIRRVESQSSTYAASVDSKDVVPPVAEFAKQTWPSHFARVADQWWVNNMQSGMNRGGIYVFDDDWRFVRRIDLPPDADPIAIHVVRASVWVSDWNNDVVRRFSMTGEPLANLDSEGLESILEASREERTRYTILSFGGVAAVVLVFIGLIVRALVVGSSKSPDTHSAAETAEPAIELTAPLHLEPDQKTRRRVTFLVGLISLLMLMGVAVMVYLFFTMENTEAVGRLMVVFAIMTGITLMIGWLNRANWGTSVTVEGDTVTLRDHTGRQSRCPIRKVRYDATAIATRDVVVILGLPNGKIYDRKEITDRLVPRLAEAQKVGPFEMIKIQIQLRHPYGIVLVLTLVAGIVYGLVELAS